MFGAPPTLVVRAEQPPAAIIGEPVSLPVTVEGLGALTLRYALIDPAATDPEARVLASGPVEGENGAFTVELGPDVTATLFPGVYQLFLLASSSDLARVTEQRVDLEIGV